MIVVIKVIMIIMIIMVMMVLLVGHVQVTLCLTESLMMQVMAMMMGVTMANVMTVTWTNGLHSSHESEAQDDSQGTSQTRHSIPGFNINSDNDIYSDNDVTYLVSLSRARTSKKVM